MTAAAAVLEAAARREGGPSVPVLLYHKIAEVPAGARHPAIHVEPRRFARQLALLATLGLTPIPLARYLDHRRNGTILPPRPVVITFDDGYRDNLTHAFPLLAARGWPATIFLVARRLGGTNAWDADEVQAPLLDLRQILEMQDGGIDFQSHTSTHVRLPTLDDARALHELRDSRERLAQLLGRAVRVIAYPWGAHDDRVLRLAGEAGYEAGMIVRRRVNFARTPMLALRRIPVWRSTSLARLAWDLARLRWRGD
jgi:peptidoglycan/xylan/chitin deacetylase (PgdA/CDA1 family)